jgi:hypothetical protein
MKHVQHAPISPLLAMRLDQQLAKIGMYNLELHLILSVLAPIQTPQHAALVDQQHAMMDTLC